MVEQIIQTPTRAEFLDFIERRLKGLNFSKKEDSDIWWMDSEVRQPGQTIVINGHRIDQPGPILKVKFVVELFGDGELEDVKTNRLDPFVEMKFSIDDGRELIEQWPVFCMFYDDQPLFDSLLNKIFNL